MRYKVHLSGYWGYDGEVDAENADEAKEKAELLLEDLDSTYLWMEHENTDVWIEEGK